MAAATWLGEDVVFEHGTGPRYVLRAYKGADLVAECGGNPISPLYEPQAKRLIEVAVNAGYSVEAEAMTPDGKSVATKYEPS